MGKFTNDIYLTLDYELFLGKKTGTVQNCLVNPMTHLVEITDKYGIPVTVFVDCAYVYMLDKLMDAYNSLKLDFDAVSENLRFCVNHGYEIQMHFHPQWLYSTYNGEEWQLDFKHYKLSDVENSVLQEAFKKSKSLVESIVEVKMCAFRAGGFCLDTFEDYISLFKSNGIVIDSSVLPNFAYQSSDVEYDYRNVPQKNLWRFSKDIKKEDKNGTFIELPIGVAKINYAYIFFKCKLCHLLHHNIDVKSFGDGLSIFESKQKVNTSFLTKFLNVYKSASIDGDNALFLGEQLRNTQGPVVVMSHPKSFSCFSLKKFEDFVRTHKNCTFRKVSEVLIYELQNSDCS